MSDTETFYVLFDEDAEGYVATNGVTPEAVEFHNDYMHSRVVKFASRGAVANWTPPATGYNRGETTLIRVVVTYEAEAVETTLEG